jgi:hypothetical protein
MRFDAQRLNGICEESIEGTEAAYDRSSLSTEILTQLSNSLPALDRGRANNGRRGREIADPCRRVTDDTGIGVQDMAMSYQS